MKLDPKQVYVGAALKFGGMAFVVGYESLTGCFYQLDSLLSSRPTISRKFIAQYPKLGLGLGGTLSGVVAILAVGYNNLAELEKSVIVEGWNVNIIEFGTISQLKKFIKPEAYKELAALARGIRITAVSAEKFDWKKIWEWIERYHSVSAKRFILTFDVPNVGVNLEISLTKSLNGEIELL